MKTPGVYVVEKNAFPNSVVEVATAVPAFIGYTGKADNNGKSLHKIPWRVTSMAEFQSYFGAAPPATFHAQLLASPASGVAPPNSYRVTSAQNIDKQFLLFYSMLLFFQNGGGPCYIVSVGDFNAAINEDDLIGGIDLLLQEQEPTMVIIPDAMRLADENACIKVQQAALLHCADATRSRVAILDIYDGYKNRQDPAGDCVAKFRSDIGLNHLSYAAAYYPWLYVSIVADKDVGYWNVDAADLTTLLKAEQVADPKQAAATKELIDQIKTPTAAYTPDSLNKTLLATSPIFVHVMTEVKQQLNRLPPSAAIAGVYCSVDQQAGVWKAPANVALTSVVAPMVSISHEDQEDLNVDTQGKSINAIRSFPGEGVLIWGARTLDGNSSDWRYINVRRTMIMLEQSIKLAARAYVFESNVAATWVTLKSMIQNFLTGIWKRGGLAGATPADAFAVSCGLGETMTANDLLEGILRVTVRVAVTRPSEFIEITFEQQMQTS